jgi:hypothetical protein
MGIRIIIAPALVMGLAVAACSRPAINSQDDTANRASTRDLRLADTPDSSTAMVSDLEAHRVTPAGAPRLERRADRTARTNRKPQPASAVVTMEVAPKMAPAGGATEVPVTLAAAPSPAPAEMVESVTYSGGGTLTSDQGGGFDAAPIGPGYGAGPRVIIRGGRGGIDDDCDLHRPGFRRLGGPPTAVHSLIPTLRGR